MSNGIPPDLQRLAAMGLRIIPVHGVTEGGACTCGQDPCATGAGKHPRISGWQHAGTTDLDQIERWAASYPVTNWGVVADDLAVIDVDPRNGGDDSIVLLRHMLPTTLTQDTGGGGTHYLYRLPEGVTLGNGKKAWHPGVDVLTGNTQFLVAPSRHVSGGDYSWRDLSTPIVELPPEVLSLLLAGGSSTAGGSTADGGVDLSNVISGLPEGQRDEGLFRAACRWRRLGLSRPEVESLALLAAARCVPAFPESQALVKVEQAFRQDHDDDLEPWMVEWVDRYARTPASDSTRLKDGGSFVFDEPDTIPALWGRDEHVLWAEGEGLMIYSDQGLGKTTIAQRLVLHMIGLGGESSLLGLPVRPLPEGKQVLYLAMDRPRQAARSLRRMVTEEHRLVLEQRIVVWKGPLPVDPTRKTQALADWIAEHCPNVAVVVFDSVKDLAPDISDGSTGAALNSAWQELIARGLEVLLLHHGRKAPNGQRREVSLDGVYGSAWLTSGLGSVIGLDGEQGQDIVDLRHLKQPAEVVPQMTLRFDRAAGSFERIDAAKSLQALLLGAGDDGITAAEGARAAYGGDDTGMIRRARTKLDALAERDLVVKRAGSNTSAGKTPTRYALSEAVKGLIAMGQARVKDDFSYEESKP